MARINKQEIMQKLIDELNLYPGKDLIPNELADKILAVYQVNAGEVAVEMPTADVVREAETTSGTNATIYTAPTTGKFYLSSACISMGATIGGGATLWHSKITVTIDGAARDILFCFCNQHNTEFLKANAQISFPNPVLIDPGSNIVLDPTVPGVGTEETKASITGYTTN